MLKTEIDELYEKIKHIESNSQKQRNDCDISLREKLDEINKLQNDIYEKQSTMEKLQHESDVLKLHYEKELTVKDENIERYDQLIKSEQEKYVLLTNEMDNCRKALNVSINIYLALFLYKLKN